MTSMFATQDGTSNQINETKTQLVRNSWTGLNDEQLPPAMYLCDILVMPAHVFLTS
jgi:hypothetical protein